MFQQTVYEGWWFFLQENVACPFFPFSVYTCIECPYYSCSRVSLAYFYIPSALCYSSHLWTACIRYSIVSRSAIGPPCGKRTVAGRIVKESYGAAKQQHTFTVSSKSLLNHARRSFVPDHLSIFQIEVLWSKGEKPLPPLRPLLIKGRNLYKLNTLRQVWKKWTFLALFYV